MAKNIFCAPYRKIRVPRSKIHVLIAKVYQIKERLWPQILFDLPSQNISLLLLLRAKAKFQQFMLMKLIVLTGESDPVFSAKNQVVWFNDLQKDTQSAGELSRLFVAPGLTHCGGGNSLDDFDPLTVLEQGHDNH